MKKKQRIRHISSIHSFLRRDLKPDLDGKNVWNALSEDTVTERKEILHNIDDIWGSAALTIHEWKVLKGTNYMGMWDSWYGPAGNRAATAYSTNLVLQSPAGKALHRQNVLPDARDIRKLRDLANVICAHDPAQNVTFVTECRPLEKPCLYNIEIDPCEQYNLAERYILVITAPTFHSTNSNFSTDIPTY